MGLHPSSAGLPVTSNHLAVAQAGQLLQEGGLGDGQKEQPEVGPQHDAKSDARPAAGRGLECDSPIRQLGRLKGWTQKSAGPYQRPMQRLKLQSLLHLALQQWSRHAG